MHFTTISECSNPQDVIMLSQKFLMYNILLPHDTDGNVVEDNNLRNNLGAHINMLAVDPDSYMPLNDIFSALDTEAPRA
jgi:hypothetical protein